MATLPARAKRMLVPLAASTTLLLAAAAAYAVAGPGSASASGPASGAQLSTTGTTAGTTGGVPAITATTSSAVGPGANQPATSSPSPAAAKAANPANLAKTSSPSSSSPFLGRIGSVTSANPSAVDTVTLTPAPAGTTLVATVLLLGTASGTPQVTDSVGNTYQLQANQADATGDTLLMYTATSIRALTATDTISVAYPAAAAHAVAIDDYSAHVTVDQAISATGNGTTASTGNTAKTTAASELAVAALADTSGTVALSGYTKLPSLATGAANLDIGWRMLTSTGTFQAGGTSAGPWLAGLLTIR